VGVAHVWAPSVVGGLKALGVVACPMPPASLTVALRETLTLFDPSGPPMTTNEVAERLDVGRRSTYDRLERLADRGEIETKKVGANARVWWRQTPVAPTTGSGGRTVDAGGEQFSLLVDAVEEYAIFMLDPDGRVQTWNQGAERIKGYERGEVLGEHLSTFYTDADREAGTPEENLADAATEGVTTDEGRRVRSDGSTFWAHVTLTAIYDDADDLRGYAKVTRDMTDRREREEAVRRERDLLEKVLETSPIGMGVFHPDGSVDRMNRRMTALLGLSREEADSYVLGDRELLDEAGEPLSFEETPAGRVVETGEPVTDQEVRIDAAGRGTRWFSVNAAPLTAADGGLEGVVATMSDVTQHKLQLDRLERQRGDLEAELGEVYERVDDAFYALDDQFRFTFVNDRAEELLDATEAELLGESVWDQFPEAKETPAWGSFHRSLEEQVTTGYEVRFDPLDLWIEANVYPSESGLSVYFRDVTERKERECELERYESVVETMVDGVFVTDAEGRYAMANDAYVEMTGYSREELIGADLSLVIGEENRAEGRDMIEEILEGERDVGVWELNQQRADGGTNLVESRFTLLPNDGEYRGTVGVVRDVTERKEREQELEEYERIVETVDDGVYVLDGAGEFQRVNSAFVGMTRFDREELLGSHASTVFGENFDELDEAANRQFEVGDSDVATFEEEIHTAADEQITVESQFKRYVVDGEPGRVGVIRDVTHRKERERELERYRTIVETVDDGIYVVDGDGRFTMANDAYAEITGYPREELLGMHVSTLVDEETIATARELERELLAGERETAKFEADLGVATGETIRAEATFSIIPDEGGDYERVGVVRDVTERVEREETLRAQRERLAALDALNEVVRDLSGAVIDQSTREEVERVVCEGLAATGSYEFAWIGDVDAGTQTVRTRTEAGVEGYLDDVTISVDPDDPRSAGPTGLAVQTHRMQTVEDALDDEAYEQWRDEAREYGFRSSAAIPIVHGGVLYGVINVYADRPNAFTGDERDVIEHLGEVVGHAIAAVERKRALTSDEVVELSFRIPGVFDAFDLPTADGRLTLEQAVPVGGGDYLEYGSATEDVLDVLDGAVESIPHWAAVRTIREPTEDVPARFELRLEEPPVISVVTALGGYVERATVEDGDYHMRIHLAPSADVRQLIDIVRDAYPMAQLVSRQQVSRASASPIQLLGRIADQLTDRQLAALEAAYFAGYFEWPREANGEEVAESFGISAPTFHQHLRSAQRKVFEVVLEDAAAV